MASTRLTVAIKDAITDQVMHHAFAGRCKAHMEAELAFAQEVYDDIMDTKMLKVDGGTGPQLPMRKVLASLPAGWCSRQTYFKAEFAGQEQKLDRYDGFENGYRENAAMIGWEAVKDRDQVNWHFPPGYTWGTLAKYEAQHPFSDRCAKLHGDRDDLRSEMSMLRTQTRATLDTASTIQKLIVIWPEIEAFASPFLQEEKAAAVLLPVVARERLNDALGLPPGARAA
ncbi:MAG TPA: Nmad5 family putative nucleotide modification protein [Acidimicrobiia bacterium]